MCSNINNNNSTEPAGIYHARQQTARW